MVRGLRLVLLVFFVGLFVPTSGSAAERSPEKIKSKKYSNLIVFAVRDESTGYPYWIWEDKLARKLGNKHIKATPAYKVLGDIKYEKDEYKVLEEIKNMGYDGMVLIQVNSLSRDTENVIRYSYNDHTSFFNTTPQLNRQEQIKLNPKMDTRMDERYNADIRCTLMDFNSGGEKIWTTVYANQQSISIDYVLWISTSQMKKRLKRSGYVGR